MVQRAVECHVNSSSSTNTYSQPICHERMQTASTVSVMSQIPGEKLNP